MHPVFRIGRYECVSLLGEGGQGRVWRAELHGPGGLRKPVALKTLADGEVLVREARIGSLLRHPNLVDVYEVGEEGGTWFCAMELCEGGTLADHAPLPPKAVVEAALQVCDALAYAHEDLGLVHLDLKPSNLLLDGSTVKVADLGIARANGFPVDTRVRGTPGYIAPEALRGEPVDARADVYALGVVLRDLLTGAAATVTFSDEDGPVAPAGSAGPLEPVVERCTMADPALRYPRMTDLAAALRALRLDGPGLAETLGAAVRSTRADAFVGRAAEICDLHDRLAVPGLVTLKGPGGIGKTRLARTGAASYAERAGARVWFCDLSEARDRAGVVRAVAASLDVPAAEGGLEDKVGWALAARGPAVVILDNFEQVVGHAGVVAAWRARARDARFLVTSRVPLHLPDEVVVEVPPLPQEDAEAVLRARARERGVEVAGDPAIPELARRLEGVPLALELAAGRLGVLSPSEVLERLDLSMLRSGGAGVPDRQITLRSALAWSWDLLSPSERAALAQLSVFTGGFTLQAAEAVVALPADAAPLVDVLAALVDASLLVAGGGRFRLLVTVQDFAREHLADAEATEARHVRFFASFGTDAALEARGGQGGASPPSARLRDLDNVLRAHERAMARGDVDAAAAAAIAAWAVLRFVGPYESAFPLVEPVLAAPGLAAHWRLRLLRVGSSIATAAGHPARAVELGRQTLDLARTAGDRRQVGLAQRVLGSALLDLGRPDEAAVELEAAAEVLDDGVDEVLAILYQQQGRYDEADRAYDRWLGRARARGDAWNEGIALGNLATLRLMQGRLDENHACLQAALERHRAAGNRRFEAFTIANLGVRHTELGEWDEAGACFEAALATQRELGSRRSAGRALGNLAIVNISRGRLAEARPQFEQSLHIARELGDRWFEGILLSNLGRLERVDGRHAAARDAWEEALAVVRASRNAAFEAFVQIHLADLDLREGRPDDAEARCDAASAILERVDDPSERARLAAVRARLAFVRGHGAAAEEALAEAERIAASIGAGSSTTVGAELDEARRTIRGRAWVAVP